ncbi:MAG: Zn-dependent protease, partial [Aristaeellaceae bacterium]
MNITAIRSDRVYRAMMTASAAEKDSMYRDMLMGPFAGKWACVGVPLRAEIAGGYDVVSAAAMSGYYTPAQITEDRRAEIDAISDEA